MIDKHNAGLDDHGQPLELRFNRLRNREKALYSLRGILLGVVSDQELAEQEVLFLDVWLKSQDNIQHHGDVVDLLDAIKNALDDRIITRSEMTDLLGVIDTIIEFGEQSSSEEEGLINELLGLLSGVAADAIITTQEYAVLTAWIESFQETHDSWPINILIPRLKKIAADKKVEEEELQDLLKTVEMITGNSFEENGIACGMATSVFTHSVDNLDWEGKKICFTGRFLSATRRELQQKARELGANISTTITKDLDLLFIGTLASWDWRFSSHGRKIEKALGYNQSGSAIKILDEDAWLRCL